MAAADENTNAALAMRGGLGSIADFLYRQQVQRPLMQAQTQQIGAQTAQTKAQTAQTEQQTQQSGALFPNVQEQSKAAAAQARLARTNANLEQLQMPDEASLTYSPEVPMQPAAPYTPTAPAAVPPPAKQTKQLPTDTYSGPSPDSGPNMSNPFFTDETGKPVTRQPAPTSASIASRFQGVKPATSVLQPSATAGEAGYIPGSSQKLRTLRPAPQIPNFSSTAGGTPSDTRADQLNLSQPSDSAPNGTPTGSAAQVNPPPAITAPQGPPAPIKYSPRNFLTERFDNLPDEIQQKLLDHAHKQMNDLGTPVTDAQIIGQYFNNQARAMQQITPAVAAQAGLMLTGLKDGKPVYERPFGAAGGLAYEQGAKLFEALNTTAGNDPAVKAAWDGYTAAQEVLRLANLASAPGQTNPGVADRALMTAFAKTIDPTIRAQLGNDEHKIIASTPLKQKFGKLIDEVWNGAELTKEARKSFVAAAGENIAASVNTANGVISRLNQQGSAMGIGSVVPPLNITMPTAGGAAPQAPVVDYVSPVQARTLPRGTLVRMPDGTIRPRI